MMTDEPERLTPEKYAHAERTGRITDAITAQHWPKLTKQAQRILSDRAASDTAKTRALYDAIDPLMQGIKQASVCRKGCNHCCHIAVAINQAEADLIGRATGLKPATPANRKLEGRTDFANAIPLGYSDPCPFLKHGECSIYDARPLACRTHYSLDTTPDVCRLDASRPVLLYKTLDIDMMGVWAAGGPYKVTIADIREFFPRGTDHAA